MILLRHFSGHSIDEHDGRVVLDSSFLYNIIRSNQSGHWCIDFQQNLGNHNCDVANSRNAIHRNSHYQAMHQNHSNSLLNYHLAYLSMYSR